MIKSLNSKKELWTTLSTDVEALENREEFVANCCFQLWECCFHVCCFQM